MSENIAAKEYLAQGGDWQQIVSEAAERGDETVVINFGPTHPSTHGVMRLVIELDGETVKDMRCLLYTSPSPRDQRGSRMPSSA